MRIARAQTKRRSKRLFSGELPSTINDACGCSSRRHTSWCCERVHHFAGATLLTPMPFRSAVDCMALAPLHSAQRLGDNT